jgi:D-alanyl-D-alanine dipeptidase
MLTPPAAAALSAAQTELRSYGLSLKVYDCYRPQRAVDEFVAWAKDLGDTKMKAEFYPRVEKTNLFKDGYIAAKSGHSRGSTVDLTLIPIPAPPQEEFASGQRLRDCTLPASRRFGDDSLDMGTGFDCFDPLAHTANPDLGAQQRRNRLLLKSTMEKFGFRNLPEEWWHYTLKDEPYPNQYFDVPIE